MTQVFSVEQWHAPDSPKGERWEHIANVSSREEAERLVSILQTKDKSAYYSYFPIEQAVFSNADEYLASLFKEAS